MSEAGWTIEIDPRYVESLIDKLGLTRSNPAVTPGSKEQAPEHGGDTCLSPRDHNLYRSCVGIAQYLSEHRYDIAVATKELSREASRPTNSSMRKLKRLGRYLKGRQRAVLHFPWTGSSDAEMKTIHVTSDSDWAGDRESRKSTSGGLVVMGNHIIKTCEDVPN